MDDGWHIFPMSLAEMKFTFVHSPKWIRAGGRFPQAAEALLDGQPMAGSCFTLALKIP